jgi:hypothetical protein
MQSLINNRYHKAGYRDELFQLNCLNRKNERKKNIRIDRIVLDNPHILNLNQVNASHSGKTCGPKAANLGQLKKMFPENVVDGLVLPFAIFRQHMGQTIPGYTTTYWEMMNGIFTTGEHMRITGDSTARVEAFILHGLIPSAY